MSTLTIDLEDEVARRVEESARREHKSISEWLGERVALVAAMEAQALANQTKDLSDMYDFGGTKQKGRDAMVSRQGFAIAGGNDQLAFRGDRCAVHGRRLTRLTERVNSANGRNGAREPLMRASSVAKKRIDD